MISASRREALKGALAVPAVVGLPKWRWQHAEPSLMVYDPALEAGRRLVAGGQEGAQALAIDGDRIRFGRELFARRPGLVVGVSRHVDALLLEEVGAEAGYRPVDWDAGHLRELIAASTDRGLVVGWVLAAHS
jgi:hypothetical protein